MKEEVTSKGREAGEAREARDAHWKEELGIRAAKLQECERRAEDDRWVDSRTNFSKFKFETTQNERFIFSLFEFKPTDVSPQG